MKQYRIGIDVGGTKMACALFDGDNAIIDRERHATPLDVDGPGLSALMLRDIEALLERNGIGHDSVRGVGIGLPSFIYFERGYVYMTSALTNLKEFPMRDYLAERLDIPVALDNDSNAAALAEYRYGAGRGSRNMIYMSASTGLGSGLILNGRLFRGSYGWAGESGHMLITPDAGLECGCGNRGCFMSWAAGRYVPDQIRVLAKGRETLMDLGPGLDCAALNEAVRAGDAVALEALEQMAHYMAVCLFNIYQLLNVNLYVFGGGLTHFGDALFGRVRREFDRYNHLPQPVEFKIAELKQDFGVIGAAELVLENG